MKMFIFYEKNVLGSGVFSVFGVGVCGRRFGVFEFQSEAGSCRRSEMGDVDCPIVTVTKLTTLKCCPAVFNTSLRTRVPKKCAAAAAANFSSRLFGSRFVKLFRRIFFFVLDA